MLAQVHLPEVVTAFEGRHVVEAFAVGREEGVTQARGVGREAHDAVLDAVQLYFDGFHVVFLFTVLLVLVTVFLLVFLLLVLVGLVLLFLLEFIVLLAQAELVVGVLIEEHQHGVFQRAPRSMATHTITVGAEEDGVAFHHPAGRRTEITATRQVEDLALAVGTHQADVGIGVVAVADEFEGEPLAIGRPAVVEAACGAVPGGAVGNLAYLLRLEIKDHQAVAVFDKGQLLTVGREGGHGALHGGGGQQHFFVDQRGVGKVGVFLAGYLGQVELPVAAAFAGIGQGAAVGGEADVGFGRRSMGDLLGGGVVGRGDKYLAADDEGHLFAVGRGSGRSGSACEVEAGHGVGIIVRQADFHLLRLAAHGLRIDFAVVGIAEGALALREEAYGVGLEGGDGQHGLRVVQPHAPHVERAAVAFAQEVDLRAVVREDGVAVFARAVGQVGVAARSGVIAPDVARDGRRVVLAPFVLEALAVLVEEGTLAVVQEADSFGGRGQHLLRPSAVGGHGIEFRHGRSGEEGARGGVLQGGVEINFLAVGREGRGYFGGRVVGEASCASAVGRHHIDVHIAFAVAGKGYLTAVGRPHGRRFVGGLRRKSYGFASLCIHFVEVALVAEGDLRAVGRDAYVAHPERSARPGRSRGREA